MLEMNVAVTMIWVKNLRFIFSKKNKKIKQKQCKVLFIESPYIYRYDIYSTLKPCDNGLVKKATIDKS